MHNSLVGFAGRVEKYRAFFYGSKLLR